MRTLLTTLHSKYIHASLALPCLAAYCHDGCGELLIREYTVHEPKETVLAQIVEIQPDVVLFSVYLWNRRETLELVASLKQIKPELKIALGGPEVSFEEHPFLHEHQLDALICGEGEIPLRHLLASWFKGRQPDSVPGLKLPDRENRDGYSQLENLDLLPSPFAAGLVDLQRGLVYYESSRGCPYTCSFCMSALDQRVRSFSLARIFADLQLLIDAGVPQIKFVDRTFNYDNRRSREIFNFLLKNNRSSHFHFEIGAHLLDEETLDLLATVPEGMFQFEIGVQSTLPETLAKIDRRASLEKLGENVRKLRQLGNIHLHLDLIAGLPGESYAQFMRSIDWVTELNAHHLQVEPVKVLPGAPLREQALALGLVFDPNPPYSVLRTPDISFAELEKLRGISRLLDLLVNSHRFNYLLPLLLAKWGSYAKLLADLEDYWRREKLFQATHSLRQIYYKLDDYLRQGFPSHEIGLYREALARDFAHSERVVGGSQPDFFVCDLSDKEQERVRQAVKAEISQLERAGKVQYFAAVFEQLPGFSERTILIFLYLTKAGRGQKVKEVRLSAD